MPAWTPEMEAESPFNEAGDIRDDLPPDVADFLNRCDISKVFTLEVKRWSNEAYAGRPTIAARLEGVIPDYDSIVRVNGPAYYGLELSWTPKGGKPRKELLKVPLVGPHWKQIHEEALKEKKQKEIEEAKHEHELAKARGENVGAAPTAVDPLKAYNEARRSMFGEFKDMAEMFGGGVAKAPVAGDGGTMQAMGMMFMGMMQMMMKQSENQTNLLIAVMGNKQQGNPMGEALGLVREVLSIKDGIMPKETHWITEVVGAISDNIGSIAGLFLRGNPPDDPMHQKLNEGLAETREKAQQDPNFARALVKHMDTKVGPKMTDQILAGFLNIKRPATGPKQVATAAGGGEDGANDAGSGNTGAAGTAEGEV